MGKNKKQVAKISIFITSIFIIFISISYAFINLTLQGTKRQVIEAGILSLQLLEDNNNISIQNALPMYDEVGMIQEAFTFRLINNGTTSANYKLKLVEIGTGTLSKSDVKYGLVKDGVNKIGLLSDLASDGTIDSGIIGASPETIEYELRLWIKDTVTDNSAISGKSLSYRVDVEAGQEIEYTVATNTSELVDSSTTGKNCITYDDGVDTFLVGQCSNNYVWYSGKLWRVVLKNNETGAVKMVTDNAITVITFNVKSEDLYENSYIDQWLNQEFLPTLHDTSTYLVENSIWDITEDSANIPTRPTQTTTVERTVGLLNSYEYYTTYASSEGLATYETVYLANGVNWWLMNPYSYFIKFVSIDFGLDNGTRNGERGVRPSVNLKSTIKIDSGSGSKSDPYILKGDLQETVPGTTLLSTRYSGEYITFNNELYRIVGVENGLTKITAVDKPNSFMFGTFHSVAEPNNFASASSKVDLENYYQSLKISNEQAYNMIQPNTTWYLGTFDQGVNYKATICQTVDDSISVRNCDKIVDTTQFATASIALPRVGEMFTSRITRRSGDIDVMFWTLTPYSQGIHWCVDFEGELSNYYDPTDPFGLRPSMYLKSNVVIASNNTGNGTYEYPYQIELGA